MKGAMVAAKTDDPWLCRVDRPVTRAVPMSCALIPVSKPAYGGSRNRYLSIASFPFPFSVVHHSTPYLAGTFGRFSAALEVPPQGTFHEPEGSHNTSSFQRATFRQRMYLVASRNVFKNLMDVYLDAALLSWEESRLRQIGVPRRQYYYL